MTRLLLLSAVLLGLHAAPAGAADVTLRGSLGKHAQKLGTVRAVELGTGKVAGAVRTRGRWALRVPAGRYGVLADARTHRARPRLVRAGKRGARVRTELRRVRAATVAPYILGIEPVRVAGVKGHPKGLSLVGVLTTELVGRDCGEGAPPIELVEIERRDDIFKEVRRSHDPDFEGPELDEANVIAPKQFVRGEGSVQGGNVTLTVRVVTAGTGAEIAQAQVSGRLRDLVDLTGALADELVRDLCAPKVDVVFTGTATYHRSEGTGATDNQHDVTATFSWTTAYRGVDLAAASPAGAPPAVAQTAEVAVTGSWRDNGRDGMEGPGSYSCGGSVLTQAPMAFAHPIRTAGGHQVVVAPFVGIGGGPDTSCTGLPGAPYSGFDLIGGDALKATVDIDAARVAAAPVEVAVAPTTSLPADCSSDRRYDTPCHQELTWSGTVAVTRVAD